MFIQFNSILFSRDFVSSNDEVSLKLSLSFGIFRNKLLSISLFIDHFHSRVVDFRFLTYSHDLHLIRNLISWKWDEKRFSSTWNFFFICLILLYFVWLHLIFLTTLNMFILSLKIKLFYLIFVLIFWNKTYNCKALSRKDFGFVC